MVSPKAQPYSLVDAFTDRPFGGNPAAVYVLPAWRDDCWLQNVAREMNQAETAFLVKTGDGFGLRWLQNVAREMNQAETAFLVKTGDEFGLRWLTPRVEVDLCGHATLASAHVLWQQGHADPAAELHFSTRSGVLKAARRGELIELDFPLTPAEPAEPPADLLPALGVSAQYVGRSRFDYLVEVDSEAVLRGLKPNFTRLAALPVRGVIVTSRSADPGFDFVSRFFAPACGIDEDPATGSSHCCLGDYWRRKLNKSEFRAYQASARGGVLRVRVAGARVFLGGTAVTVARGELIAG